MGRERRRSEGKEVGEEKETQLPIMEGRESESARLGPGIANAISARLEVILCYIYL